MQYMCACVRISHPRHVILSHLLKKVLHTRCSSVTVSTHISYLRDSGFEYKPVSAYPHCRFPWFSSGPTDWGSNVLPVTFHISFDLYSLYRAFKYKFGGGGVGQT
jgi:hypothetical protein